MLTDIVFVNHIWYKQHLWSRNER